MYVSVVCMLCSVYAGVVLGVWICVCRKQVCRAYMWDVWCVMHVWCGGDSR